MGRGRYLGFMDADGDIDADAFISFVELAEMFERTSCSAVKGIRCPTSSIPS